ncbi:hypothetical protein RclHR1_02170007 [Rhizophagus clarus]|uniref:Uncharacterized protein n=1 Tax=Rhizophagus clarus TaxID=94130 RepID=A0A2Z6RM63_9GLOM|nr:hypothetical protein RclHR1_02170007 [Rhizophagus clarus]
MVQFIKILKKSQLLQNMFLKRKDYDKFSIWVYDIDNEDIETEIKKIDNLINKLNDQKREDNAEEIDKKIEEIEKC